MGGIPQHFNRVQVGIANRIAKSKHITEDEPAAIFEDAVKFAQRFARPSPMMRAVAGYDQVESGIGKGQVFHITEASLDVYQAPVLCQNFDLVKHRGCEIQGNDFGCRRCETCRSMPSSAACVQYAFIPLKVGSFDHDRQVFSLCMHCACQVSCRDTAKLLLQRRPSDQSLLSLSVRRSASVAAVLSKAFQNCRHCLYSKLQGFHRYAFVGGVNGCAEIRTGRQFHG